MEWWQILLALASPIVALGVAVWSHFNNRSAIGRSQAVETARASDRMDAMDRRIDDVHAEVSSVKTDVATGFSKIQASLDGFAAAMGDLRTTVAVLVDRDDRRTPTPRRRTKASP